MLLAVFVRQQWRFGSCEERDLSSVKRKEVREAALAERNIGGGVTRNTGVQNYIRRCVDIKTVHLFNNSSRVYLENIRIRRF